MAITKETEIAQIEIVWEYKIIQVAYDIVIKEDGKEISRTRNRESFASNQDVSHKEQEIKDLANMYWTDELKASYLKHIENQEVIV